MELLGNITKFTQKKTVKTPSFSKVMEDDQLLKYKNKTVKTNPHLHSPSHLLAEEISTKLNDRRHFAIYLGLANKLDHNFLRSILGQVLEGKEIKTPGKLFMYLVKKNRIVNK